MWPWNADDSLSSIVARGLGSYSMIWSAAMEIAGACCLVVPVPVALWCQNKYSRFAVSWSGCCVVVSWYLQGVLWRDQRWSSEDSKVALKKAGYYSWKLDGIGYTESAAVIA